MMRSGKSPSLLFGRKLGKRKLGKHLFGAIITFAAAASLTGPTVLAATGPGVKTTAKERPPQAYAAQLKVASETDQIVLVVGDESGKSRVTVSYYRRDAEDGWKEVFSVPGYCGYNGITSDKKEGDRKTPAGDYQFTMAFGIYDNPDSVLEYHKVKSTDYWVDDSASQYYNKLVNTAVTPVSWKSAEHLINIVPQYHYGLVLNYNQDCVPGKGSAIFLHGYHTTKTWTEGCIAIPEEQVKLLIQNLDGNSRILLASGAQELSALEATEP